MAKRNVWREVIRKEEGLLRKLINNSYDKTVTGNLLAEGRADM